MASDTIAIQFLRAVANTVNAKGIDLAAVASGVINPALLEHNQARVTGDQLAAVARLLWQQTDDELFGLASRAVPRGTFRMLTLGLIHTPDLGTALARLADFTGISFGASAALAVDETARLARFEIDLDHAAAGDPVVVEIALAVIHRFASWLIARQIRLQAIELRYPPTPYAADYPIVFGMHPCFGSSRTALHFDDMYLRLPIVRIESDLRQFIRNSPADMFARREYVATTEQRVRQILERNQAGAWLPADKVAARLSLSTQHLRRLLSAEGTSFRAIQEQILRDRAIESLTRGGETIEALATRLGYSEPSAFRRAFRRWTGTPPGAYRATSDRPQASAHRPYA